MQTKTVRLTRRQLYDEVWATPMAQLCKKYGLSDVGIAHLCKRHNIPRPPRGYWRQKEVGRAPPQTPLPLPKRESEIVIKDASSGAANKHPPHPHIEVAETLDGAHELVRKALEKLQAAPTDDDGFIVAPEKTLAVHVSKGTLHRALRIIDALLKALELRGYHVAAGPVVSIVGVEVRFGISEVASEIKEEVSDDVDLDGDYEFHHSRFNKRTVPVGRLTLDIIDPAQYLAVGRRRTWTDANKQQVENVLNKAVTSMIHIAADAKHAYEEQEREAEAQRLAQLRREEEIRLRAEKRVLFKAEKERVEKLLQQAKDWRRSEDIRAFVEQVRQTHLVAHGTIPEDGETGQWVAWALKQADRLDPTRESPPSILDEKIPDEAEIQRAYRGW